MSVFFVLLYILRNRHLLINVIHRNINYRSRSCGFVFVSDYRLFLFFLRLLIYFFFGILFGRTIPYYCFFIVFLEFTIILANLNSFVKIINVFLCFSRILIINYYVIKLIVLIIQNFVQCCIDSVFKVCGLFCGTYIIFRQSPLFFFATHFYTPQINNDFCHFSLLPFFGSVFIITYFCLFAS